MYRVSKEDKQVWRPNCDPHYSRNLTWATIFIFYVFFAFFPGFVFPWRRITVVFFSVWSLVLEVGGVQRCECIDKRGHTYRDLSVILIPAESWRRPPLVCCLCTLVPWCSISNEYRCFVMVWLFIWEVIHCFSNGIRFFEFQRALCIGWARRTNKYGDLTVILITAETWPELSLVSCTFIPKGVCLSITHESRCFMLLVKEVADAFSDRGSCFVLSRCNINQYLSISKENGIMYGDSNVILVTAETWPELPLVSREDFVHFSHDLLFTHPWEPMVIVRLFIWQVVDSCSDLMVYFQYTRYSVSGGKEDRHVWSLYCDPHFRRNLTWAPSRSYLVVFFFFHGVCLSVTHEYTPVVISVWLFSLEIIDSFSWFHGILFVLILWRGTRFQVSASKGRAIDRTNENGGSSLILITAETWPEPPLVSRAVVRFFALHLGSLCDTPMAISDVCCVVGDFGGFWRSSSCGTR